MAETKTAAVSKDGFVIPLIDFSRFLHGTPDERSATATAILDGFRTAGFIYLKNYGLSDEKVRHIFSRSVDFFAQSKEAKAELPWESPEANRGYVAAGREKLSQLDDKDAIRKLRDDVPDLKETYEIGREPHPEFKNKWPRDEGRLKGFKDDMMDLFAKGHQLHLQVMRAVALAMGLKENYFDSFIDEAENTLRLLHYPGVKADVFRIKPGQVRAGAHTDYGTITLLFQDQRGGLQVKTPSGDFVDATPIEGTIVVNAGDMLARWSNDIIKSTMHRVVEPAHDEGDEHPSRYSIAYFGSPNPESLIETLPGTYTTEEEKKYKGVNAGEYLVQRLAATFS